MPISLLTTKLYIPRVRPDSVPRPRLIERLRQESSGRLTLISAPAGFGKTTLVGEWIPHSERCVCWVSLDESDNEPVRFWSYFIAALQMLRADLGENTQAILDAQGQQRHSPWPESFLTLLINEIAAFPDEFALVLDDYHAINTPAIHEGITFLLDHLPRSIHLIIASRTDPPLPLARWRARGQLSEIHTDELRFTPEETAAFANQVMGLNLTSEDIDALEERTEGWIAGLQLAALSMQGRNPQDQHNFIALFTGSHRYILDYLAEEVFNRQPENVQNFLLQTAILDRLNGSLCEAVTGQADGGEMLESLERAHLFIVPLDDKRRWYRYHHLFADVLRHRLRQEQPDLIPELHRRAAAWYDQNNVISETMKHALTAPDFDRAANLIEKSYPGMISHCSATILLNWIDALPEELIRSRPRLSLAKAWIIIHLDRMEEAEAYLEDAEKTIRTADSDKVEVRSILGEIAAVRATMAVMRDDAQRIIESARQALKYLPDEQQYLRGILSANLSVAYILLGNIAAARRAGNEAVRVGNAINNKTVLFFGHFCLAGITLSEGRLRRCVEHLHQALQAAKTSSSTIKEPELHHIGVNYLPISTLAHRMMGEVLYECNDLESAVRSVDISLELSRHWWVRDEKIKTYMILARAQQARGNQAAAFAALQQAEQLAEDQYIPCMLTRVAVSQIRQWISKGHLDAALHWADMRSPFGGQQKPKPEDHWSFPQEFEVMALVRLLIARDKFEEAEWCLDPVLRSLESRKLILELIDALVLRALIFHARGNTDDAIAVLGRALSLAEGEGYIRTFVDEGEPMEALLKRVTGKSRAYAAKLLTVFNIPESKNGASKEQPATILEISGGVLIEPLSRRESELLPLLANGLSNQEIANKLYISVDTVKVHLKHIYGKFEVSSRTQAVARARELKLLN